MNSNEIKPILFQTCFRQQKKQKMNEKIKYIYVQKNIENILYNMLK